MRHEILAGCRRCFNAVKRRACRLLVAPGLHFLEAAALLSFIATARACPPDVASGPPGWATPARFVAAHRAALVAWRPRAWSPAASTPLAASGFWVSRDPVDGAYVTPPASDLAGRVFIGADGRVIDPDAPVQIDRLADGTLIAHLDARWADFAVAKIGADGKPAWTCVSGPQGALKFMANPVIVMTPAGVKREDR